MVRSITSRFLQYPGERQTLERDAFLLKEEILFRRHYKRSSQSAGCPQTNSPFSPIRISPERIPLRVNDFITIFGAIQSQSRSIREFCEVMHYRSMDPGRILEPGPIAPQFPMSKNSAVPQHDQQIKHPPGRTSSGSSSLPDPQQTFFGDRPLNVHRPRCVPIRTGPSPHISRPLPRPLI